MKHVDVEAYEMHYSEILEYLKKYRKLNKKDEVKVFIGNDLYVLPGEFNDFTSTAMDNGDLWTDEEYFKVVIFHDPKKPVDSTN